MLHIKRKKIGIGLLVLTTFAGHVFGQQKPLVINIDLNRTYQTIDNFGASDAWAAKFVGNWPEVKKNTIADLLFSQDTLSNGSPKGIGLSLWRFNLGAGSAQQGDRSGIKDEWRREESFLNAGGQFDWSRQAGQQWFLRAAKQRGVANFLCFSNSAPVQFTLNGKAFADKGRTNLSPEKYAAFAAYLFKAITGLEQANGIKFNYVSPVNEPQWAWSDGGQEGCPFNKYEIGGLVKTISKTFADEQLSSKIVIAEAGSIEYLYQPAAKPEKGSQINNFFKQDGTAYIGNQPQVASIIAAHSYFTTSPAGKAMSMRKALADSIATVKDLRYWMTEYCILGDNEGEMNGRKRDLGIDAALYMARVIHTDLAVANASAWQWWTALSPYNYKDGLIYIDKNKTDGNFYSSKMLWALGNYSRFVRPGAIRVDAAPALAATNQWVLVSAYKQGQNLVIVIVNPGNQPVGLNLNVKGGKAAWQRSYTTSAQKELTPDAIGNKQELLIEPRSITTFTGLLN